MIALRLPDVERQAALASYYEISLALIEGKVHEFSAGRRARVVLEGAAHVAISEFHGYAIDSERRIIAWESGSDRLAVLLDDAALVSAGNDGLLAIRCDGSLWQRSRDSREWSRVADTAVHAWVGDGADYYVDGDGRLFVRGQAHRGQFGNGRTEKSDDWVYVADDVAFVVAHTGHALHLRHDGIVMGTGGNRYGPLGTHGYGDKATTWGKVFDNARGIASGSRHSLAIRSDRTLWTWGSAEGLTPKAILNDVVAVSAGRDESAAMTADGAVWNWRVGAAPTKIKLLA